MVGFPLGRRWRWWRREGIGRRSTVGTRQSARTRLISMLHVDGRIDCDYIASVRIGLLGWVVFGTYRRIGVDLSGLYMVIFSLFLI